MPESQQPIFVSRLRLAVDRLHTVLLETPFPPLEPAPTTQEELAVAYNSIREWAAMIDQAYRGRAKSSDDAGLAALLTDLQSGSVSIETKPVDVAIHDPGRRGFARIAEDAVRWNKPIPLKTKPTKSIARQVRAFRYAASPLEFIGEAPSSLRRSGAERFSRYLDKVPNFITESPPHITLSLDNWPLILESLETARQYIMYKGFRLITWVRTEIEHFEEAAYPRIVLRTGSGEGFLLKIDHCGVSITRPIPRAEARLLQDLKHRQSCVCARSSKKALAGRVPEIAAYITKPTAPPRSKPKLHESAYALPEALRDRIKIDKNASIRLRN